MLHIKDLASSVLSLLEISPNDRPGAIKILFRKSGVPISTFTSVYFDVVSYHLQIINARAKAKKCDPLSIGIVRDEITGIVGPNLHAPDFTALLFDLRPLLEVEEIKSQTVIAN